jgi:hypothetical protein
MRQWCLDATLLKKMGLLTRARMAKEDDLFFLQLLLLLWLCDPAESGVDGDPRHACCTRAEQRSQKHANGLGLGGSHGHEFKQVKAQELVHFDAALVRDGAQGGGDGALFHRWQKSRTIYDPRIAKRITCTPWLQIKGTIKLRDKKLAPNKGGENGHDPAHKHNCMSCNH